MIDSHPALKGHDETHRVSVSFERRRLSWCRDGRAISSHVRKREAVSRTKIPNRRWDIVVSDVTCSCGANAPVSVSK